MMSVCAVLVLQIETIKSLFIVHSTDWSTVATQPDKIPRHWESEWK